MDQLGIRREAGGFYAGVSEFRKPEFRRTETGVSEVEKREVQRAVFSLKL